MLLYTPQINSRLEYIGSFIGKELFGTAIELTTDRDRYLAFEGARINYSTERMTTRECWLQPHRLLFETGITQQDTTCFSFSGYKGFFRVDGDFPFDIFAASFYLLTRYEEYLPHKKDMYGRYAHENSLAYREGFLDIPLIDCWIKEFGQALRSKFPTIPLHVKRFKFIPSYDIDIAWSYRHKGWWRNAGGFTRSLLRGDWRGINERFRVLSGRQPDPFDAYDWMNQLHERYGLKPYYFFLLAASTAPYDKNIHPRNQYMIALIKQHLANYPVGIHPSWQSGDDDRLLEKEIETLQRISGMKIINSRQHYIRFLLPQGYRRLIAKGIQSDFSMGYGSINGFRASTSSPFLWYDLEAETQTDLTLFPFCYMEANSYFEQRYNAERALAEMRHYCKVVKDVEGTYIMIWHNSFLGTDRIAAGWREAYEQFIREIKS